MAKKPLSIERMYRGTEKQRLGDQVLIFKDDVAIEDEEGQPISENTVAVAKKFPKDFKISGDKGNNDLEPPDSETDEPAAGETEKPEENKPSGKAIKNGKK